jgi:hypothetical protein
MYILRAFAFLSFLAQGIFAQQQTPILPDPKLTPDDTFDVTVQDVCVPGYAKKVRAAPAWLKRQAYTEYGITRYKTGDYEIDDLIIGFLNFTRLGFRRYADSALVGRI